MATVHWDKDGVLLETGNKYSIYNDGDFYYLEVMALKIQEFILNNHRSTTYPNTIKDSTTAPLRTAREWLAAHPR